MKNLDTIGIAEIKRNISTLINRVAFGRDRIILASRGKPKAALVSMEDLHKLETLDPDPSPPGRSRRKAALAMARTVREMTLARRKGAPFVDVAEDLRRLRKDRDIEIEGLR